MFFGRSKNREAKVLKELYLLEWKITSNAYADVYAAQDKESHEKILLCLGRSTLSEKQQASFVRYVQKLKAAQINDVRDCGVDAEGVGYVALSSAAGKRVDFDHPDVSRLRRRFLVSLVLIERLHQSGIVCGHLSSESFLLDAEARPQFVDFVGFSAVDASAPAIANEFLTYRRPGDEQLGRVSAESDVYALAVIGLQLFGATFPPGFIEKTALPESLKKMREDTPQWVYSILLNIVESPAKRLFNNSSELLAAIALNERSTKEAASDDGKPQETFDVIRKIKRGRSIAPMVSAVVIATALGLVGALFIMRPPAPTSGVATAGESVSEVVTGALLDEQMQQKLALLSSSDDPRVHQKLENVVRDTSVPEVRRLAWLVISDRMGRLGSRRVSRVLKEKVTALTDDALQNLLAISSAFDPYQEVAARREVFKQYLKADDQFACNLIVAASLDSARIDDFKDLLKTCVDRKREKFLESREHDLSSLALVAILDNAGTRYSEDIKARAGDLPEADILWLFNSTASKDPAILRMLAEVALSRKFIQWPRRVFMQALEATAASPGTPSDALIHSATLGPSESDIAQYTAWYDPESVKVLFAVLLETSNETVPSQAFDALDNKPLGDQLTRDLMDFVKMRAPESRARYANLVGGLALRSELDEAAFSKYLLSIQGVSIERDVYLFLLHHGDAKVVRAVLDAKGSIFNPVSLVDLLKNADSQVRTLVIPYLKTITVASARRAVRDYYLQERSPEVRAVFEREIPGIGG